MRRFFIAGLLLTSLLLAPLLAQAAPASPVATQIRSASGPLVQLRADPAVRRAFVRAPAPVSPQAARAATIRVVYNGFPTEARAAFQRAVDIWQTQISSPVEIVVEAYWQPLPEQVLGAAGPLQVFRDFPGAPRSATWYPVALANKLSGRDLSPGIPDIRAIFSSSFSNWYFGTDGKTPANEYDLTTVVLHELGHGLGFVGSMEMVGNVGGWGVQGLPMAFDRFAVNGAGQTLLDTTLFPNPSVGLGAQLTGGNLFFAGANAIAAAGGAPPRLYAPNPWEDGSSFSHFDEQTYPAGSPNALMTPRLAKAEAIHNPGAIALGLFRDLGWSIESEPIAPVAPTRLKRVVKQRKVTLTWQDNASNETGYVVERATKPKTGKPRYKEVARLKPNTTSFSQTLKKGTYYFRIKACADTLCSPYSKVMTVQIK